ncbi:MULTISPECIES: M56 family metallopeptidase [unclassified Sedimentibacter]|uniref:M56 family metallopeptidase n=1 Tax=unclassified Sedimentibacter TaxID=2649220 RepID=UPI0027DF0E99|nr:M56 family metallopeptidase [Sedimentibacter sp. MB35-C1]WMJ77486.1 M56 family metallopeptidase [Sedimentibacter sp. MB35-C1]
MLEKLFLQVINMSYIGSIVIMFILFARILLKKAPKKYSYILWTVALFRLIVPISFDSILSLIPVNPTPISNDVMYNLEPYINTGMHNIDQSISGSLPTADAVASVNPMHVWIFLGSLIWVLGIAVLLIYGAVSLTKIKKRLKNASCEMNNIYYSNKVETPFVLGLIKPKIYLSASLSEIEKEYIVLHEQTHIKRFDHVIRFISYLALCIHWFNPLAWIAFWLSGKDMEMSCDESVISQLGHNVKKDYSQSLLNLSIKRRNFGMTPLAFGEGETKGRVKNIINFKQPKFYVVVIATIVLLVAVVGLLSNPKNEEPDLSLLNINNFLSAMATCDYIAVETEDNDSLSVSPNSSFLEIFEQEKWKEKRMNPPIEGTATLRIILHDGYYINFYSDETYAMIYNEDTQEKYRYYAVSESVYINLQNYVLENGKVIDAKVPPTTDSEEVGEFTYIGYISGFEESDGNQIIFDPIEWITLEDNDRIQELKIEEFDMPNGYYIYNPEVEQIVYEVGENAEYRFIDWGNDFASSDEDRFHYSTKDKEEFIRYLNTYSNKAVNVPFWIKMQDSVVVIIEEQYVP